MQHHYAPAHQCAEENPRNAFSVFQPQFKQARAEGFGMRLAKVGPKTIILRVSTIYRAARVSGRSRI